MTFFKLLNILIIGKYQNLSKKIILNYIICGIAVVSRMGAILNERLWEFSNSLFKNLINKMRGEKRPFLLDRGTIKQSYI